MQENLTVWSEGTRLAADLWIPDDLATGERRPAVLLCHGWGGLKEHLNATYARWFCKGGLVAMTFDYRGWGESDPKLVPVEPPAAVEGEELVTVRARPVREVVDPFDQVLDITHCLDYLAAEPRVDPDRIGIWGSSYGGGHAVYVGARDPRIKAIVSQVAPQQPPSSDEYAAHARGRAVARARGEIGPIPPEADGVPGLAGTPDVAKMIHYRPMDGAEHIRVPTLVIDAENEELFDRTRNGIVLAEIVSRHAPAEYRTYPCLHYEIYEKYYREASTLARDWFTRHLTQ